MMNVIFSYAQQELPLLQFVTAASCLTSHCTSLRRAWLHLLCNWPLDSWSQVGPPSAFLSPLRHHQLSQPGTSRASEPATLVGLAYAPSSSLLTLGCGPTASETQSRKVCPSSLQQFGPRDAKESLKKLATTVQPPCFSLICSLSPPSLHDRRPSC